PAGGRLVCNASGAQYVPKLCSDGQGGFIAMWSDRRDSLTTGTDIYAQHVLANGTIDPAWPANGAAVCTAPTGQSPWSVVPDAAPGAIVTWQDIRNFGATTYDIYAQRVLSTGVVDPAWPAQGRAVAASADLEENPNIAPDDAGGAFVSWENFSTNYSYLAHV